MNPAIFASLPTSACTLGAQGTGANDFGPDRITRTLYDPAGQRVQLRKGVGTSIEAAETTWAYTPNGRVAAVIDGNGNRAELHYDAYDRQDRWTFPSPTGPSNYDTSTIALSLSTAGGVNSNDYEAYGYDPNGNRTSLRKRDNHPTAYGVITYEYDALNRMTRRVVPERGAPHPHPLDPWHTRDVHYGYDLRGLQTYARFDSATGPGVTNSYDGFGRLQWTDQSDNGGTVRRLAYQYDRNGNRMRITHPDGNWFGTAYDGAGRPFYLDANGTAGIDYRVHNNDGTLASSNRVNTATGLAYDAMQRRTAQGHYFFGGGGAGTAMWTYGYNPASGIASETRDNDAYAWQGHYAVNRGYTTNGLNQYTAAGSASFTYDANGNLTSDGSRTFTYDVENRLVTASNGATLRYDPLGRLWVTSAPGFETIRYLYDGDALVAEYDAAGTQLARFVHGPAAGADDPLVWYGGSSLASPRQLFADSRGSIVAVADHSGTLIAINRYDEYGIPASSNAGRFQYTGQIWLPELGMYHYKARIYSPTLGRFLQTDPIGYDDQVNLYAYVGNDPVNHVDSNGQQSTSIIFPFCSGCHYPRSVSVEPPPPPPFSTSQIAVDSMLRVVNNSTARAIYEVRRASPVSLNESVEDRRRRSPPRRVEPGTQPISDAGIGTEDIHKIKPAIGAGPRDYVGIQLDGTIITTDPTTGNAEPQGNISDHGVERETTRGRPRPPRRRSNDEEQ